MSIVEKIRKYKAVISILVIACLVISSFYVYFEFFAKKQIVEEVQIKEIDDRISPLCTQALFFEVKRIRMHGIIDQMLNPNPVVKAVRNLPIKDKFFTKLGIGGEDIIAAIDGMLPGKGWGEKPSFRFDMKFDNYLYKDPVVFNTWDTGFIFKMPYRVVQQENETAEVGFQIIEKIPEKKLLRKDTTNDKELTSFKIVYDFRTGRWAGDDYLGDSDGYCYFDCKDYEIWFELYQTDNDKDGIPYWTEVNVLDTDPTVDDSKLDPDNDGIPTAWEWKWGYDPFVYDNHSTLDPDLDGLQNTEEYFMRKYLANPYHGEIYIEVDWSEKAPFKPFRIEMQKAKFLPINIPKIVKTNDWGMDHTFWEESQQLIIERFSEHNITVIIDDGDIETGGNHPGGDILPIVGGNFKSWYSQDTGYFSLFYNTKFDDNRKGIFRYLIITHTGGYSYNMDFGGCYDTIVIYKYPAFFKNVNGNAVTPRTRRIGQAVAVLHELGHSCGISYKHCGGVDNFLNDGTWDNYKSCMNYVKYGQRLFDYSNGIHGENDANDWGILYLGHFQTSEDELEGVGFNPIIYGRIDPRYEKKDRARDV